MFRADPMAPVTSPTLLQQITQGDGEAWHRFAKLYRPVLERWLRRLQISPGDAEDVLQEVFIAVAKNLTRLSLEANGCSFRRWLWIVVKSKANDHFRRAQANAQALETIWQDLSANLQLFEEPPTDLQSDRELLCQQALQLIRPTFSPATWQSFWYTTVDEMDPSEVAERLGMTRWAVYKARTRVLQRLRTEIEGLLDVASPTFDAPENRSTDPPCE